MDYKEAVGIIKNDFPKLDWPEQRTKASDLLKTWKKDNKSAISAEKKKNKPRQREVRAVLRGENGRLIDLAKTDASKALRIMNVYYKNRKKRLDIVTSEMVLAEDAKQAEIESHIAENYIDIGSLTPEQQEFLKIVKKDDKS